MVSIHDKRLWISMIGMVGLGSLSGITMAHPKDYYLSLNLPFFAPPSWLFGPVWIILYLMLGIAFYAIWVRKDFHKRSISLLLFCLQLLANLFWSFLFFNQKNIFAALIDISILFFLLALLQSLLFSTRRRLFYLLLAYQLWIAFATALTYAIYRLN